MNQTIQISDVSDFMKNHLVEVFDTMLSMKAVPTTGAPPAPGERVTGSVGFAGQTVIGAVYLHLSAPFARTATAAMLGMTVQEISSDAEVNDVVGEITNMLTGGLKSWLCDAGADCAVSTPAIIRGRQYDVEPMPDVKQECLLFDCGSERIVAEIHIKLN